MKSCWAFIIIMDVKKTIAELTSQLSEINYDSEEENILLKDSNQSSADDDYTFDTNNKSNLRKAIESVKLPENIYGGRKISRKKIDSHSESSEPESLIDPPSESSSSDPEFLKSDKDTIIQDEVEDENSDIEDVNESEEGSGSDSNEDNEVEMTSSQSLQSEKDSERDCNIYSAASKNVPNDVKKGVAIRNQLRIWESLLECRIKLQKGLAASNSLPVREQLLEAKSKLDLENQQRLNKSKQNLLALLEKLVDLQEKLLKQSAEYHKGNEITPELDDEIPSDDSGMDNEEEGNKLEEDDQPSRKKRKLNDYSSTLKSLYVNVIPYRNASIQKWNDKTKVSTGKMANSNFSAFDQSTLRQIEQIMADKRRLINRTRVKRYNDANKNMDETNAQSQDAPLDPEIFDDTDFYHKLLRDYIERKSVGAANSSNTERQLMELQKLRSKMKKNVDTKSTKGRKLRYVVLPKLVNFMAPRPYNTWNEPAEAELYNSLFGKIKLT